MQMMIFIIKYPLLSFLILKRIDAKKQLVYEVLSRICDDCQLIMKYFSLEFIGVQNIEFSMGDSHNGGKTVVILKFNNGRKVVYKPHSLTPDRSYHHLLEWIREKSQDHIKFYDVGVLDRGDYGWQEYVANEGCKGREEVKSYYYEIGAILALFHIFRTKDIHYENIIAKGSHPVIIDLETFLSNEETDDLKDRFFLGNYAKEVDNSVYGTLLLPNNLELSKFDVDISGVGGRSNQKSNSLVIDKLVNNGTDSIRFIKDYAEFLSSGKAVNINGELQDPYDYCGNIMEGFKEGYSIMLENRDELVKLIKDRNMLYGKYRQVLRATQVYGRFIEASCHPNYLKSQEDRIKLFSYLYGKNNLRPVEVVQKEIDSLFINDVPYFWTEIDSSDLYCQSGICKPSYYRNTLAGTLLKRIEILNEKDMQKQLALIEASIICTRDNEIVSTNNNMGIPVKRFSLTIDGISRYDKHLRLAKNIGDYLYENAIWDGDRNKCTWMALNIQKDNKLKFGPLNYSLYEGVGLIIFLAFLAAEVHEEKYTDFAKAAFKGVEDIYGTDGSNLKLSVFHGLGSLVYLYYTLSRLWDDPCLHNKYSGYLQKLFEYKIDEDNDIDIISGVSGIIMLILNIYSHEKDPLLLAIAGKFGDFLMSELKKSGGDILTGFSHGYAGLSCALFMLYGALGIDDYYKLGMDLILRENAFYDSSIDNWLDLRSKTGKSGVVFWCHGAPGIALSRAIVKKSLNGKYTSTINKDIDTALKKTLYEGFADGMNHSMCHGQMGNLDILLKVSAIIGDEDLKKQVLQISEDIIAQILKKGIICANANNLETVNFMVGLSGVGYGFLRLHNPEIPSILALDVIKA